MRYVAELRHRDARIWQLDVHECDPELYRTGRSLFGTYLDLPRHVTATRRRPRRSVWPLPGGGGPGGGPVGPLICGLRYANPRRRPWWPGPVVDAEGSDDGAPRGVVAGAVAPFGEGRGCECPVPDLLDNIDIRLAPVAPGVTPESFSHLTPWSHLSR